MFLFPFSKTLFNKLIIKTTLTTPPKINKNTWVQWKEVNLRDSNSTDGQIIQKFKNGTYMWSLEEAGFANGYEWAKVNVSIPKTFFWQADDVNGTKVGYMVKQALKDGWVPSDTELITKDATYITTPPIDQDKNSPINVRETADGVSKVIDTVNWGVEVKVIDGAAYSYGYNRSKIEYTTKLGPITQKKQGWIPVEFLVKKN